MKLGFEMWGVIEVNEFESYKRYVLHNVVDGTSNYEVHIITSTYGNGNDKDIQICYSIDNDERQRIEETDYIHNLQNAYYLATSNKLTFK